jgi:hypothetical protein
MTIEHGYPVSQTKDGDLKGMEVKGRLILAYVRSSTRNFSSRRFLQSVENVSLPALVPVHLIKSACVVI